MTRIQRIKADLILICFYPFYLRHLRLNLAHKKSFQRVRHGRLAAAAGMIFSVIRSVPRISSTSYSSPGFIEPRTYV